MLTQSADYETLFDNPPIQTSSFPFFRESVPSVSPARPPFHVSRKKYQTTQRSKTLSKKLLLCHDFRGNYLNDRWINGSEYNNSYEVTDWSLVDIFCYFSHEFITVPPNSWISACHKHGVQVIGTVITEWENGAMVCQELFQSLESSQHAAEYLIQSAVKTGIDGWLINIENPIPLDLLDNLKFFLSTLTQGMHSALGNGTQVIWYDAVTIEGTLRWQDGLTPLNKPFFDLCDGIFINYTWKDGSMATTLENLAGSPREGDVYYGIDVFGRNCIGGYSCCETILRLSSGNESEFESKFSIAIFAPGWLIETQVPEPPMDYLLDGKSTNKTVLHRYEEMNQSLKTASQLFWKRISDVWRRSTGGGIRYLPEMTNPIEDSDSSSQSDCDTILISSTNFSPAAGLFVFVEGECYPHWPTINSMKLTARASTEKFYRPLTDEPILLPSPTDPLSLPCIPFYNLSLQDMRCRIHCADLDTSSTSPLPIDTTDRFGWNGTGAMRFFSQHPIPSSSDPLEASSYLEIPIQMKVSPTTTVQLRYLCPASSSFHLVMRLSFETDSISSLPPSTPLEIPFSLTRSKGNSDDDNSQSLEVSCLIHGVKRTLQMKSTVLGPAQRRPYYHWADESSDANTSSVSSSDGFPPLYWHQISFQLQLSSDDEFREALPLLSLEQIELTNCRIHLTDLTEDEFEIGFVLGSFSLFSSAASTALAPSLLTLVNPSSQQQVLIVNAEVDDIFSCQEDGRVAVSFRWEAMRLRHGHGNCLSLPITQVYFFAIRHSETLVALLSATQFHSPSCSSSFLLVGAGLPSALLADGIPLCSEKDLILCGAATSSSSFKFNLTQDMGKELSELGLERAQVDFSSPQAPCRDRYFAIAIRPVSEYLARVPLHSCPLLLIRHPLGPLSQSLLVDRDV